MTAFVSAASRWSSSCWRLTDRPLLRIETSDRQVHSLTPALSAQLPLWQSESSLHASPAAHRAAHVEPPQSMSVSSLFFAPSSQGEGGAGIEQLKYSTMKFVVLSHCASFRSETSLAGVVPLLELLVALAEGHSVSVVGVAEVSGVAG